jgi:endoglucanase
MKGGQGFFNPPWDSSFQFLQRMRQPQSTVAGPLRLASAFENRLTRHMTTSRSILCSCTAWRRSGRKYFAAALLAGLLVNLAVAAAPAPTIRLNTVGYLPKAEKKASIAIPCTNFTVILLPVEKKVFSGKATGPVQNADTQEELYTADFSACTKPGEYALDIPGVGRSAPFRIGKNLYREPFYTAMRGFYLWRCGTAVKGTYRGQTFAHAPCHTNDAWLDFVGGGHTVKDGTKGWHDAGDYNKYTVNAGVTVGSLFRAWEDFKPRLRKVRLDIPESGGKLPDFLAEMKWEMDWLLTMQAEDGSAYHKLTTKKFGGFISPETETAERYFTPWGSEATANFVGMTAQASRIFKPYNRAFADRCLQAARRSYEFLKTHPEYHKADQTGFSTGAYEENQPDHRLGGPPQNRIWAAAEIWETTGDAEALRDLETRIKAINGRVGHDFDWDEVKELGLLTYLSSKRPGRDPALVKLVREHLLAVADKIVQARNEHGYGRPLGTEYFWGCNGAVARQTLLLMAAGRQAPKSKKSEYRATCLDTLNHLFGRNYYGRSFVTGIGSEPPMHPHDRRSGDGKGPWPGYLVGGPHPKAGNWQDIQDDFRTNEIAINWNAALVYALAACLE